MKRMTDIILFIICIVICWVLIEYMRFKSCSLLKHLIEANNLFCIAYLIVSCIFLTFDAFAVWKSLACVLAVFIILLLTFIIKKVPGRQCRHEKCPKEEIVLLLVIICMIVPLIFITTEDIAADTDQGAYFLHTCILMEEKSKEVHSLSEMGKISEEADEGLGILMKDLPSFYHEGNENLYYMHALSTWCSFPALFGKMFGIWNCMKAVNYLYILLIFNFYFVCRENAARQQNIYLYIVMFALSPLLLYIGKAGLSEIAALYLVSLSLHYMFEKELWFSILSGISIGLFGYVHISMYVYMPAVTALALLESTRKKKAAYFNIVQLVLFGMSIWYAYKISPHYVKVQYSRFTLNGKINYFIVFGCIDLIVLLCISVQIYIMKRQNTFFVTLKNILSVNYRKAAIAVSGIIFIQTVYYAYFMCFTDKFAIAEGYDAGTWNLRSNYINKGIIAASHLNLVNIGRAVGVIGLLVFIMIPFFKYELSENAKIFYYFALYGFIIFTVMQMDTPSNYYCSRYFVSVLIPMIALTVVSAIKSRDWCIYIAMAVVLYNHHFWPSFLMGAPKVGQFKLLREVLEVIPEDAIVFCNPESHMLNARLSGNLRVLNDNEVYNLDNIEQVLNAYPNRESYIISERELEVDGDLIKSNIYVSQYSFGNGVDGRYDTRVGTYEIPIYIYQTKYSE